MADNDPKTGGTTGTTTGGTTGTTTGTPITGKDLTGTWNVTVDSYTDVLGGTCKVSPTVTMHMDCTYTYGTNCTYTSTCTVSGPGLPSMPPVTSTDGTACTDPTATANTTPHGDACNTQYAIVTGNNPLSMTITGTISGAKSVVMTQTKK